MSAFVAQGAHRQSRSRPLTATPAVSSIVVVALGTTGILQVSQGVWHGLGPAANVRVGLGVAPFEANVGAVANGRSGASGLRRAGVVFGHVSAIVDAPRQGERDLVADTGPL